MNFRDVKHKVNLETECKERERDVFMDIVSHCVSGQKQRGRQMQCPMNQPAPS